MPQYTNDVHVHVHALCAKRKYVMIDTSKHSCCEQRTTTTRCRTVRAAEVCDDDVFLGARERAEVTVEGLEVEVHVAMCLHRLQVGVALAAVVAAVRLLTCSRRQCARMHTSHVRVITSILYRCYNGMLIRTNQHCFWAIQ